jgi:folate-dependent phosphoribosylglycinamide formyltransferase PurN
MRVAVIAGSLAVGLRIAAEIERLPVVDVSIVCANQGMRPLFLRWLREIALLMKSFRWRYLTKLWRYARSRKLLILARDPDDPVAVEQIRELQFDLGLHGVNVIYREATIAAFRLGILNAHIGILPGYRGRSVAEWSVLQGDPTGITVFFIDSGIDTGPRIVLREVIPSKGSASVQALKARLFASDARIYRQALEALMSEGFEYQYNDVSLGKRYYVMSSLLTGVVDTILVDCNG